MTAAPTLVRADAPPSSTPGRMALLDVVRLLAALSVVLYHFLAGPTVEPYWQEAPGRTMGALQGASRYGWLGVEVFFVVSGLVIARSARRASVAGFVASRVGRLFPAYWAAVVVTVLLLVAWEGARYSDPAGAVANLTMVHGAFGVPSVQVAFWTLLVELKFYALVAVLVASGGFGPRRILWLSLLWPTVSTALWELQRSGPPDGLVTLTSVLCELLVPRYAPFFALGMLVYLWRECRRSPLFWTALATSVPLAVDGIRRGAREAAQLQGVPISATVALVVFGVGLAVVVVAALARFGPRAAGVMAAAGALTYPLYLVHGELGYATIDLTSGHLPAPVVLLAAVLVSVAVAVALHVGVERRGGPALRAAVLRGLGGAPRRDDPAGPRGGAGVCGRLVAAGGAPAGEEGWLSGRKRRS